VPVAQEVLWRRAPRFGEIPSNGRPLREIAGMGRACRARGTERTIHENDLAFAKPEAYSSCENQAFYEEEL
jgi:hypothetical protein